MIIVFIMYFYTVLGMIHLMPQYPQVRRMSFKLPIRLVEDFYLGHTDVWMVHLLNKINPVFNTNKTVCDQFHKKHVNNLPQYRFNYKYLQICNVILLISHIYTMQSMQLYLKYVMEKP